LPAPSAPAKTIPFSFPYLAHRTETETVLRPHHPRKRPPEDLVVAAVADVIDVALALDQIAGSTLL
jgi:hypothetical protein